MPNLQDAISGQPTDDSGRGMTEQTHEALDPSATPARLLELTEQHPLAVLQNPVLLLIALEDPACFSQIYYHASQRALGLALRHDAEAFTQHAPPLHPRVLREHLRSRFSAHFKALSAQSPLSLDPDADDAESAAATVSYNINEELYQRALSAVPAPRCFVLAARFIRHALPYAPTRFYGRFGLLTVLLFVEERGAGATPTPAAVQLATRRAARLAACLQLEPSPRSSPVGSLSKTLSAAVLAALQGDLFEAAEQARTLVAIGRSDSALARGEDWSNIWDEACDDEHHWQLSQLVAP